MTKSLGRMDLGHTENKPKSSSFGLGGHAQIGQAVLSLNFLQMCQVPLFVEYVTVFLSSLFSEILLHRFLIVELGKIIKICHLLIKPPSTRWGYIALLMSVGRSICQSVCRLVNQTLSG